MMFNFATQHVILGFESEIIKLSFLAEEKSKERIGTEQFKDLGQYTRKDGRRRHTADSSFYPFFSGEVRSYQADASSHLVFGCRMIVRMSHSKAIFISKWKGLLTPLNPSET
uniref:Uncharacterized protein n=1 Tax=Solanum lycopersicum TaxID=4081 RepID=A0A3Q7HFG3_SOLLC